MRSLGRVLSVGIAFSLAVAGGVAAAPHADERIVGGDVADPADWPFMAALSTRGGSPFCGGSVVSADAVVTAGHCVMGTRPGQVRVVTGRPDLSDESAGEELVVTQVSVHPKYRRRGFHDIAVLRLADPTSATPVLLPTRPEGVAETAPGLEFRVAGWGGTERTGAQPSDVLLDVAVFAISDQDCRQYFNFYRPGEELCAFGEPQGGDRYDDSCYGDSGGPLVRNAASGALLVGVVSYGGRLCGVREPGVYTRVADNRGWVRTKAGLRP